MLLSPKVKHIPRKTLGMRRGGEKLGAGWAQEEAGRRRETERREGRVWRATAGRMEC